MKPGGIYTITHIETGRIYIGSTIHFEKRWQQHRYRLSLGNHDNRKLQGSWKKHDGSAFVFSILEVVNDVDLLLEREKFHVDALAPYYNLAPVIRKGTVYAQEQARQMGYANRGRVTSPETKRKLSEAGKGRIHSEETRRKLSEAHTGRIRTEEHQRKITLAKTGFVHSEETRAKMSAAQKGKHTGPFSEEHRKHLSEVAKARSNKPGFTANFSGKKHSEETRQKLSEIAKCRKASEETRRKISEAHKGRKASEETRRKLSEAMYRRYGKEPPMESPRLA